MKVLGSRELLADVLGARVYPNAHKEIGWFPVQRTAASAASPLFSTLPAEFTAFHWHGDTFDLPPGAVHLARSEACAHQAFAYRTALALQFHVESTPESVVALISNCGHDLAPGRYVQPPERIMSADVFGPLGQTLFHILDRFAESKPSDLQE